METRSKELEDQLKRDIERFKRKTAEDKVEEEAEGLGAVAEQAAGAMSKVSAVLWAVKAHVSCSRCTSVLSGFEDRLRLQ